MLAFRSIKIKPSQLPIHDPRFSANKPWQNNFACPRVHALPCHHHHAIYIIDKKKTELKTYPEAAPEAEELPAAEPSPAVMEKKPL